MRTPARIVCRHTEVSPAPEVIAQGTDQKRRSYRKPTRIVGEVSVGDRFRNRRVPCKVVDMSASGARLEIDRKDCWTRTGGDCLTSLLRLLLDRKGTCVDCQIVWRAGNDIGMRFRSPIYHAA